MCCNLLIRHVPDAARLLSIQRRTITLTILTWALWLSTNTPSNLLRGADVPDRAALTAALSEPILPPGLVEQEHRQWCEPKVATLVLPTQAAVWRDEAARIRDRLLDRVVLRGAPTEWIKPGPPNFIVDDWQEGGSGYRFRKLRYEALPGLWIPAVLYEPKGLTGRVPVALHVNGHDPLGKAAVYKQIRSINLAQRGIITLNVEWLGMGQLCGAGFAHGRMNQLEMCGVSGLAPFYLAMQRGLDYLLKHPSADPERVAVSGLSGGGWQTIFLSALDERVTLSNPVAGYSSVKTRLQHHSDLGDSEQTPTDMAMIADYTHLTALRAPRPTLLTYNAKDDCCFAAAHALPPLLEAAAPIYKLFDAAPKLRHHINELPGTHNYERENREAYYALLADSFAPANADWPRTEIECAAEVKTAEQLTFALPESNADFHTLAQRLAKDLPRRAEPPADLDPAAWRRERQTLLAEILRTPILPLAVRGIKPDEDGGMKVTRWRLRIGDSWTVPAVEFTPVDSKGTTLIVTDAGRKSVAAVVEEQLRLGQRVIACDPFYLGESAFANRPYLFALLVATVGDRPLGLQARQIQSITRWAAGDEPDAKVQVIAVGPRVSLATLTAAALGPSAIGRAELRQSLESLHDVLERNWSYDQAPECFCFGLLEHFDIRHLIELAKPSEIVLTKPVE